VCDYATTDGRRATTGVVIFSVAVGKSRRQGDVADQLGASAAIHTQVETVSAQIAVDADAEREHQLASETEGRTAAQGRIEPDTTVMHVNPLRALLTVDVGDDRRPRTRRELDPMDLIALTRRRCQMVDLSLSRQARRLAHETDARGLRAYVAAATVAPVTRSPTTPWDDRRSRLATIAGSNWLPLPARHSAIACSAVSASR
jgi:hypothetical protein